MRIELLGFVDEVPFLEVWACIPVGSIDGITFAITVEVANPGAFGMEVTG